MVQPLTITLCWTALHQQAGCNYSVELHSAMVAAKNLQNMQKSCHKKKRGHLDMHAHKLVL